MEEPAVADVLENTSVAPTSQATAWVKYELEDRDGLAQKRFTFNHPEPEVAYLGCW